ncbi:winged helix DNA-binding protein [Flavitalea sp. BT771]|uniref:MarR family winged helix-turn-helix transcriptional regulator n=1 Tax=Flavitalea sp. BT771 TaxID=3063329 RepID=UPI0026E1F849|nr:winged helix DNA-binding protein [Flavitalea sp. BT771]MDO6432816.1 winged helix DNA-binding protein [Flavitalea sp. BT771]MDV6221908.1 winged helix DNA-binding protein [Flavitalea sp. BT771]
MSDYSFFLQLLPELQAYEAETGKKPAEIQSFAQWLGKRYSVSSTAGELESRLAWNGKGNGGKPHYTASNLITALSRYKMIYVKLALEGTPFETYDEFVFVLSLVFAGPYTQSQLIERHVQLKPTGMEVIRRLLRKNLITQEPSGSDKRSKVLHATDAGRTAFYETLSRINDVTDMVMAPLSAEERLRLLELLQKLDKAHRDVFMNNKKMELGELLEKFGVQRS